MPTRAQINAAVGRRFTELAQQAVADKTPAAGGGVDGPKGWSSFPRESVAPDPAD